MPGDRWAGGIVLSSQRVATAYIANKSIRGIDLGDPAEEESWCALCLEVKTQIS